MSIKIYSGLRLAQSSLESAFDALLSTREILAKNRNDIIARHLAERATTRRDRFLLSQEGESPMAFSDCLFEYFDEVREIASTRRRNPQIDTEFEVVIFPTEAGILAIPYCEQASLVQDLKEAIGAGDFGYWNNSDRPEGLSEEDWETRGIIWSDAISRDPGSRPGFAGLTVKLLEEMTVSLRPDDLVRAQADLNTRAERLAKEVTLDHFAVHTEDKNPMRGFYRALSKSGTPDWESHLSAEKDRILGILPERYDASTLFGG